VKRLLAILGFGVLGLAGIGAWANLPPSPLPAGAKADRLLLLKSKRQLVLYSHGQVLAEYSVALGRHPVGPKEQQGDGRTPEGLYFIDYHNRNSSFFRALHVSYPDRADRARAASRRVDPGGAVMIHGLPPRLSRLGRLQRFVDWTSGCIAVSNAEIQQIFDAVPERTPIEIRP